MLGRILNILGWIGTALVIAAVGVRFARPELQQVWYGLAVAGLVCVLLYLASQWREIGGTFTRREWVRSGSCAWSTRRRRRGRSHDGG